MQPIEADAEVSARVEASVMGRRALAVALPWRAVPRAPSYDDTP